ncbi:MAG: DUF2388 domain-containing protein [Pseudomonas sp.]
MRTKLALPLAALLALPTGSALADSDFWRDVISSGATTASTYLTFRKKHDDKLILAAREDASSFVASNGTIRGPYLEAALQQLRSEQPGLSASSDMDLASAILAAE